jgi:signal transduction histidine kinase
VAPDTQHSSETPKVDSRPRYWISSVRAKTVAAAVVVVGIALGVASVLLVTELSASQLRGVDRILRLETASVAGLSKSGALSNPLRTSGGETSFIQVVAPTGGVVASSASLEGQDRITSFPPEGSQASYRTLSNLPIGPGGQFRVAALNVDTSSGRLIIYSGQSLASINSSVHGLTVGLLVADPILLFIVGVTVWWLVRRALSPVEAIRTEVAEISTSALDRRVAVPPVHDEIGRLAVTMNDMLARIEAGNQRQMTFVSDASHELRSPLAAAQAELEVALTHRHSADWPEAARITLGDLERVRRIVDDLLVLARYDEGGMPEVAAEVDLDEIVLDECTRLRRTSPVAIDATKVSGARVFGDRERLGRAVRNLLDNAVRHAHQRVAVELCQTTGQVELLVSDDGPGVDPEDRHRIFERFARADSARARWTGGSGLGLAIVYEIITAHGGMVEVADADPGARFIIHFPSTESALKAGPST